MAGVVAPEVAALLPKTEEVVDATGAPKTEEVVDAAGAPDADGEPEDLGPPNVKPADGLVAGEKMEAFRPEAAGLAGVFFASVADFPAPKRPAKGGWDEDEELLPNASLGAAGLS